jgi:hypothetical protein
MVSVLPNGSRGDSDTSLGPGERVLLPVGKYTFGARLETPAGTLQAFRDDVTVDEGRVTEVAVDVGSTGLLTVTLAGTDEGGWVMGLTRPGETRVGSWNQAEATFRVPTGRWDLRFENREGLVVRRFVERGVAVEKGEHKRLVVQAR